MLIKFLKILYSILPTLNPRRSIKSYLLNRFIINKEIKSLKETEKKTVVVVYDCNCSPPTLGDFFCTMMMARFFLLKKKKVKFYIVKDKVRRENWRRLKRNNYKKKISEFKKLAKILLSNTSSSFTVSSVKFSYLKNKILISNKFHIFFEKRVLERKRIYNFCTNLIFRIVINEGSNFERKFLLNKNTFSKTYKNKIDNDYITLHLRKAINDKNSDYSKFISQWRNIDDNQISKILVSIHNKFPKYKIYLISDKFGTNYFKKIIYKKGTLTSDIVKKIRFSKDFTRSFLEDGHVILNSKYYFQIWGGGPCVFTYFSKINFLRVSEILTNETPYLYPFKSRPFAPWHERSKNIFIETFKKETKIFYKALEELKNQ